MKTARPIAIVILACVLGSIFLAKHLLASLTLQDPAFVAQRIVTTAAPTPLLGLQSNLSAFFQMSQTSGNETSATNDFLAIAVANPGSSNLGVTARWYESASSQFHIVSNATSGSALDLSSCSNYTIAAWVWLNTTNTIQGIVTRRAPGGGVYPYLVYFDSLRGSRFATLVNGPSPIFSHYYAIATNSVPTPQAWHFVCFRRSPSNILTEVNCVSETPVVVPSYTAWDSNTCLNSFASLRTEAANTLNGAIGPVMIWRRRLSNTEISNVFNKGTNVTFSSLR